MSELMQRLRISEDKIKELKSENRKLHDKICEVEGNNKEMGTIINQRLHTMASEYCARAETQLSGGLRKSRAVLIPNTKSANQLIRESQERIEKAESLYSPLANSFKHLSYKPQETMSSVHSMKML